MWHLCCVQPWFVLVEVCTVQHKNRALQLKQIDSGNKWGSSHVQTTWFQDITHDMWRPQVVISDNKRGSFRFLLLCLVTENKRQLLSLVLQTVSVFGQMVKESKPLHPPSVNREQCERSREGKTFFLIAVAARPSSSKKWTHSFDRMSSIKANLMSRMETCKLEILVCV